MKCRWAQCLCRNNLFSWSSSFMTQFCCIYSTPQLLHYTVCTKRALQNILDKSHNVWEDFFSITFDVFSLSKLHPRASCKLSGIIGFGSDFPDKLFRTIETKQIVCFPDKTKIDKYFYFDCRCKKWKLSDHLSNEPLLSL